MLKLGALGEKLEREEVDILIKECCDPEDDDGFIPYERKSIPNGVELALPLSFQLS